MFEAFKKYAVFSGRASRSEYWLFMLFVLTVNFVLIVWNMISYNQNVLEILLAYFFDYISYHTLDYGSYIPIISDLFYNLKRWLGAAFCFAVGFLFFSFQPFIFIVGVVFVFAFIELSQYHIDFATQTLPSILLLSFNLMVFIPSLSVFCRRMHDIGRSGYNWFWSFNFIISIPIVLLLKWISWSDVIFAIVGLIQMLIWYFIFARLFEGGDLNENKYGANPINEKECEINTKFLDKNDEDVLTQDEKHFLHILNVLPQFGVLILAISMILVSVCVMFFAKNKEFNKELVASYYYKVITSTDTTEYRVENEYDSKGNLTKKSVYYYNGCIYKDRPAKSFYEHDAKGNVIEELQCAACGGNWFYGREYEYDSTGRKVKANNHLKSIWVIGDTTYYEYDSKGNLTKEITYTYNGGSYWSSNYDIIVDSKTIEYEYDSKRNKIREIIYTYNHSWSDESSDYDSIIVDSKTIKYEYDSKGNKTKEITYDKNGVEKSRTEYEYDSKGNKTKEITYDKNGVEKSRTEYYFYNYIKQWELKVKDLLPKEQETIVCG
jgi:uncharacterized membrane protein YhaH (DUF805 family)